MLVLTRKLGEDVVIGEVVLVRFVAVQGDKIRLGIEAPRDVPVLRRELVMLTPSEREAEMREAGSRRFVREVAA